MKNVAAILPEDAAQGLRVRAAENGLGVSNWLVEQIEGMRRREGEYAVVQKRFLAGKPRNIGRPTPIRNKLRDRTDVRSLMPWK